MPKKKVSRSDNDKWEEWGENLGRKIEARFATAPKARRQRISIGELMVGLFILTWGIVWLGNDLGWWAIPFPLWPVILILISVAIFLSIVKKVFLK